MAKFSNFKKEFTFVSCEDITLLPKKEDLVQI
jgi:hypothetical protein